MTEQPDLVNQIIHGDALEELKKIPDNSIDLIVTDPPYMISQKGNEIIRKNLNSKSMKRNMNIRLDFGAWDNFDSEKEFFDFTESWFKECARFQNPEFRKDDCSNSLTSVQKDNLLFDGYIFRRLTPKECFRLMGFLNDEINIECIPENKLYELAGNGWDINLVSKIFKEMLKNE